MQRRGAPRQPTEGRNPMDMLSQMMPPEGPPTGPPAGPPMEMESDMPPMSPEEMQAMMPQDIDMMSMDELTAEGEGLPQTGLVVSIEEGMVTVQNDMGETNIVPIDSFPIEPVEGMELMQATVVEVTDRGISVVVGPEKIPTELPAEILRDEFNPGDYFWMPAPPMEAGALGAGQAPEMESGMPPDMMGM